MPIRKRKKYTRPKNLYDKERIDEENTLIKRYGLKNKREIWKADSAIEKMRRQAKLLLTKSQEEQDNFIKRLEKQGFQVKSISDILSLDKEDYLKRRFQSIVVKKGLSTTAKQARQFIVHKHISIDDKIVNIPSYLVPVDKESKIELRLVKKEKKTPKIEEVVNELREENKEGSGKKIEPKEKVKEDNSNSEGGENGKE